jgi:hypothetical protein
MRLCDAIAFETARPSPTRSDILSESEKGFFTSMKRSCEASIAIGNPIVF